MSSRGDTPTTGLASVPGPDVFREEFGEPLTAVLDIGSWRGGRDPAAEYQRIEQEVAQAVQFEDRAHARLREQVFRLLEDPAVPQMGHYPVTAQEVVEAQQGLLFNGGVQACDGTNDVHDTLALTIYQLGVALVSYTGGQDCYQAQLFRRDMRSEHDDPTQSVIELLERRQRRHGMHAAAAAADQLSELARRGITSYMERYALVHRATAEWRLGHGSPAPLEMVGTGFTDLVIRSIRLVRELLAHGRFVFVGSEQGHRGEVTIGHALRPLEYVVIGTLEHYLDGALGRWRPIHETTEPLRWDERDARPLTPREWMARFRGDVAGHIVYGLYRATALAGPQLFFAHKEHVHVAARIAIADSRFSERRGFPMLIDLADHVCRSAYGGGSLQEMAQAAYARAGALHRFQSERHTRDQ